MWVREIGMSNWHNISKIDSECADVRVIYFKTTWHTNSKLEWTNDFKTIHTFTKEV